MRIRQPTLKQALRQSQRRAVTVNESVEIKVGNWVLFEDGGGNLIARNDHLCITKILVESQFNG